MVDLIFNNEEFQMISFDNKISSNNEIIFQCLLLVKLNMEDQ